MSWPTETTELEELQEFLTPCGPVHNNAGTLDDYAKQLIYLVSYIAGAGLNLDDVALRAIEIVRGQLDAKGA